MTSEELVKSTAGLFGAVGSAFYFTAENRARGKEIGLDGFRWYFLGRGGVLGDVEAPVVQSAFGYFSGALVTKMWDSARQRSKLTPRQAGGAFLE